MRILTKFDIRNGAVVKGINYEGVEKVGNYLEVYNNTCTYISNNVNKNFEIILNDVTASLYNINSGEVNIKNILSHCWSLPHIYSGGINDTNASSKLNMGTDRIMINTALHDNVSIIKSIINIYGAQILIASIEARFINNDYYVYKSYGRDDTAVKLLDWIKILYNNGIIEILIISIDKDGTLTGYDNNLLSYIKNDITLYTHLRILYAGGIQNMSEIQDIENKYSFVEGVCISTLFYKNIMPKLYFLSYIDGNKQSVINHYSSTNKCITVDNISEIPINGELCINGHYNTYQLLKILKKRNDYKPLKEGLNNKSLRYIGICAGLQLLVSYIKDEYSDELEEGLDIIKNTTIIKLEKPNIGFIKDKFFCHSYILLDSEGNFIKEYIIDNIKAYQYHPENSN